MQERERNTCVHVHKIGVSVQVRERGERGGEEREEGRRGENGRRGKEREGERRM